MRDGKRLTFRDVKKLAQLANLALTDEELKKYPDQLSQSLDYVENLKDIDTQDISEAAYTMDVANVMREDVIDTSRMFTQKQALSNAKNTKNGKFVVKRIL